MSLRYVMQQRWTDGATCEVFRRVWTTTSAKEAEAAMRSGGYGCGFDRTECIGIELEPDDTALAGGGK